MGFLRYLNTPKFNSIDFVTICFVVICLENDNTWGALAFYLACFVINVLLGVIVNRNEDV